MTCSDASSIRRWMAHVDGATRIIEVRGEDQLDRPEGLELFRHLRVGIVSILRSYYTQIVTCIPSEAPS
jgi:hypothetical protein